MEEYNLSLTIDELEALTCGMVVLEKLTADNPDAPIPANYDEVMDSLTMKFFNARFGTTYSSYEEVVAGLVNDSL